MNKLHIVMYHYVRDLKNSRYPQIKGLDCRLFKEQIEFFSEHFHVVSMEEVLAYYREGQSLPENALLLTFDDGYIDNYTFVFPILKAYHMQGSFFVPGKVFMEHALLDVNKIHFLLAAEPIQVLKKELLEQMDAYRGLPWDYPSNQELYETYAFPGRYDSGEVVFFKRMLQTVLPEQLRNNISSNLFQKYIGVPEETFARELYLSYDQMKVMRQGGMFFGVHGYDHYWMNRLKPEELKADIEKGLKCMEGLVDKNCWVINYPYGSYSSQVVESLKGSGCVLGLTIDVRVADLDRDNPYLLPRLDTNDYPPKSRKYLEIEKMEDKYR